MKNNILRHCSVTALSIGLICLFTIDAKAQLIGNNDQLNLALIPSEKLRDGQVYPIAPSQFLHELQRPLIGAGLLVAPASDATRLVIEVQAYDSGPYLGFSKTARITVGYRLQKPGIAATESWSDHCEAKAGVDMQDAPDRNRTAVSMCLTMLGAQLAEKLAGPRAEIMVN